MELKDFIRETLVQISEGVIAAKAELSEKDILINPGSSPDGTSVYPSDSAERRIQEVAFNVVVSVDKAGATKGGIMVITGLLSGGGSKNNEVKDSSTNKISFTIPISLPYTKGK